MDKFQQRLNHFYCVSIGLFSVMEFPNIIQTFKDPSSVLGLGLPFFQSYENAKNANDESQIKMANVLAYQVASTKFLGFGMMIASLLGDNKMKFTTVSIFLTHLALMKLSVVDQLIEMKNKNQLSEEGNKWPLFMRKNVLFVVTPVFLINLAGYGYLLFGNKD